MGGNNVFRETPFDGEVLAASGSDWSFVIGMDDYQLNGFFGAMIIVSAGTGEVDIEFWVSGDGGTNYVRMSTTPIFNNFSASSGNDSNGKAMVAFAPPPCTHLKFKATEVGGANSITFSLHLVMI